MSISFTSDKNINRLQYELRQIFPEDKWTAIQSSVRDAALVWFKQHSEQLHLIYKRDGLSGLNKKFISDMIASAEYFDHTQEPAYRQDQIFDTDNADPNIVADQPMPYVNGVENPMFIFSTFSKKYGATGKPETEYIYREKPDFGGPDFEAYTMTGPGPRLRPGQNKHYSDFSIQPNNETPYNISDQFSSTPIRSHDSKYYNTGSQDCGRFRKAFTGLKNKLLNKNQGFANVSEDYGESMAKHIYNVDQPKLFPNAYGGYKLGTIVDGYDGHPNNLTTNTVRTLNQMNFGDVPVVTMMDNAEIAELGSRLYRQKNNVKRQRAPRQNGQCIPRQEYVDQVFDEYPTTQVRAKFHLDQIYNTPESRINTIMDPVMGKSAMWNSQERSMLDIPCSAISQVPPSNIPRNGYSGDPQYMRSHHYPDHYSDSCAVPGCNSFASEPRRQAYPTRDYVPARYSTMYQRI
jgi:hypothetical protein